MGSATSHLSTDDFERRVVARQLELLSAPTRGAVIGTPLWAAVVCLIAAGAFPAMGTIPLEASLPWFGAVISVSLAVAGVEAAYQRASKFANYDPRVWVWRYTLALALLSVVWASLVWIFWIEDNSTNQLSLTLLVFCGLTNGIVARMNKFETFLVGSGLAILVLWAKFLTESSDVSQIFGVLLPIWFIAMTFNVRTASSHVTRNIETQIENEILNEAIAKARDDAERARAAAEQASQMKSSFLANMSHELRTPLNAILGFSEIISTNALGDQPARYQGYAKDIHGSGRHLLSLINDILDVAKIEAGKMKLDGEWLDGAQVLDDTLKLVADRAAEKKLDLLRHCDADLRLFADERALKQILLNLLSNAIKFTNTGHVAASLKADGDWVVLTVSDSGCGISPEGIKRVFNAFEQADNRYARGGTGLGLTLVRALAGLHGGSCAIDSEEGKGTRAAVRLPLPKSARDQDGRAPVTRAA